MPEQKFPPSPGINVASAVSVEQGIKTEVQLSLPALRTFVSDIGDREMLVEHMAVT